MYWEGYLRCLGYARFSMINTSYPDDTCVFYVREDPW